LIIGACSLECSLCRLRGIWGSGLGIRGLWFGVRAVGLGVHILVVGCWGLRYGVLGLGCEVWGLGFGVWGLRFDVRGVCLGNLTQSRTPTYLRNPQTLNINRARTPSTLISLDPAPKPRTFTPHTQPLRTYTPNSYVQYPSTLSSKPQGP